MNVCVCVCICYKLNIQDTERIKRTITNRVMKKDNTIIKIKEDKDTNRDQSSLILIIRSLIIMINMSELHRVI